MTPATPVKRGRRASRVGPLTGVWSAEIGNLYFLERKQIMITKTLLVINGLNGQETPVRVEDGATPSSIVRKLGLGSYNLARVKDRQVLRSNCNVVRAVGEGERLFAYAPIDVGGAS